VVRISDGNEHPKANSRRLKMTFIANAIDRTFGIQVEVEVLKTVAIFCGTGLTASLLLASYGLDLSPGFF
jgi:hypothetical protein